MLKHVLFGTVGFFLFVNAAYDIRDETYEKRRMICNTQVATCDAACGGLTVKNDCDSAGMIWSCVCNGNRLPSPDEVTFPVEYYKCIGSYDVCYSDCISTINFSGTVQGCYDRCKMLHNCGKIQVKWPQGGDNSTGETKEPSVVFDSDSGSGSSDDGFVLPTSGSSPKIYHTIFSIAPLFIWALI